MDDRCYIWCRTCDAIHHVSRFDREPIYTCAQGELALVPSNDWRDFMDRHAGHRLEPLKATGAEYFPGCAWGPMSTRYFEVSNGERTLLLRRSRSSVHEPFCYEVVEGRLVQTGVRLEVQADAIRKEMKMHFQWAPAAPLADEKIARFIAIFREVVSEIDASCMRERGHSDGDANVTYCEIDSSTVEKLLTQCSGYFQPDELACLRRFVDAHRAADDVMALIERRFVAIEQRPE